MLFSVHFFNYICVVVVVVFMAGRLSRIVQPAVNKQPTRARFVAALQDSYQNTGNRILLIYHADPCMRQGSLFGGRGLGQAAIFFPPRISSKRHLLLL